MQSEAQGTKGRKHWGRAAPAESGGLRRVAAPAAQWPAAPARARARALTSWCRRPAAPRLPGTRGARAGASPPGAGTRLADGGRRPARGSSSGGRRYTMSPHKAAARAERGRRSGGREAARAGAEAGGPPGARLPLCGSARPPGEGARRRAECRRRRSRAGEPRAPRGAGEAGLAAGEHAGAALAPAPPPSSPPPPHPRGGGGAGGARRGAGQERPRAGPQSRLACGARSAESFCGLGRAAFAPRRRGCGGCGGCGLPSPRLGGGGAPNHDRGAALSSGTARATHQSGDTLPGSGHDLIGERTRFRAGWRGLSPGGGGRGRGVCGGPGDQGSRALSFTRLPSHLLGKVAADCGRQKLVESPGAGGGLQKQIP